MTNATGKKLYYFNEAFECINNTNDKKQCHGAVLVCGNKIISRGKNQSRGRILKKNVCSTHAEIDCLNKLPTTCRNRHWNRGILFEKRYKKQEDRHLHYPEGIGWSWIVQAM